MRILSLNIWNQNWHWDKRLRIIQDMLKFGGLNGEGNDILGFLEVKNDEDHHQLREINHELEYEYVYEFVVKDDDSGQYAMGVLSNLEAVRQEYVPLSMDEQDSDDTFPRGVGLLELKKKGRRYVVAITHFAISQKAQLRNGQEALAAIGDFNSEDLPVFVCADLNSAPVEPPAKLFVDTGFTDVWAELSHKELDTWPVEVDLVVENYVKKHGVRPDWKVEPRRIDYIFTKNIPARSVEKLGKEVNGIWHSDHWGIVAKI